MRGELMQKILETFEDIALFPIDSAEVILKAGYGASLGRLEYEREKIRHRRSERREKKKEEKEKERKVQKYVSKLKADGLLEESKTGTGKLVLSEGGRKKLMDLRQYCGYKNYKREPVSNLIIVTFDIPESKRNKRDWLRNVLKRLGLEMVQKSVWIGKIKVPGELLADLERLEILEHVEIFEVTKSGTLRKVKN